MRLARALVLALTTITLAAVAHLLGGGALPSRGVLVVLTGVVGLVALVASQHRLGTASIAALLGGGQALLHGTFSTLATSGADPAMLGHVVGHGHHQQLVVHASAHAAHAAGHAAHHHASVPMLLAHVVATLVTALVLARGERALWLLAGWLAPVVPLLMARPADWPRPALPTLPTPRPVSADVALVAPRRGPPVLVCPA